MFGPAIQEADDDDPRWARWRKAVGEFHATGLWPHAGWSSLIPFPPGTELPPFVWILRGDEVWNWDGSAWVRSDPQPPRTLSLLDGTTCAERQHCDMTVVTTAHIVCDDCGSTGLTIPDGFTAEEWRAAQWGFRASPV